MIDLLNQYDHSLMLWLNYDGGTLLDAFWYAVSYKFSWVPLYLAVLCVLVRLGKAQAAGISPRAMEQTASATHLAGHPWRNVLWLVLTTALVILLSDQISSGLIKPLVQRPRPSHEPLLMEQLHYVNGYHGGPFGFVSSHAANTLALAVWLSLLLRQRSLWCALVVFYVANSYSRIYLGVHYPGDILCGSFIGALCGWLGYILYNRYCLRATTASPTAQATPSASPTAQAIAPNTPQAATVSAAPITTTFWASLLIMLLYAVL